LLNWLEPGSQTRSWRATVPGEFSSNPGPDQTHQRKLIKVFRISRNSQVGVFDQAQGWS